MMLCICGYRGISLCFDKGSPTWLGLSCTRLGLSHICSFRFVPQGSKPIGAPASGAQQLHFTNTVILVCNNGQEGQLESLNGKSASLVCNSQFREAMTFTHTALKYPVFLSARFLFPSLPLYFLLFLPPPNTPVVNASCQGFFSLSPFSLIVLFYPFPPSPVLSTHLLPYF